MATPSGEQETVTSVVLRNLTNPSPPGSTALQLGAVAAVYVLWLISWLVLGPEVFGPAHYNWAQTLVAAAAALLAFVASWRAASPYPAFLVMIGLGLTLLAVSWVTYSPDASRPLLRFAADGAPSYSDLSYALFVFVWVCAWGYLALRKWQRRPPSALTGVVFVVLIGGLAVILVSFYYPEYRSSIEHDVGPSRRGDGRSRVRGAGHRSGVHPDRPAGRTDVDADRNGAAGGERHGLQRIGRSGSNRARVDAGPVPPRIRSARVSTAEGAIAAAAGPRPRAIRPLGSPHSSFARGHAPVGGDRTGVRAPGLEVVPGRALRGGVRGGRGLAHRPFR